MVFVKYRFFRFGFFRQHAKLAIFCYYMSMDLSHIRNFSIIAHIDHGKSTLADRMLEITGSIPERKMREQVLDSMELERERGITIKMQPVRMAFTPGLEAGEEYAGRTFELNLIDTPGHIDFSYEVSRALKAVEGSILLVDATQGVQAQTLTTLGMARELGLTIIPAVSKVDSPLARVDEVKIELAILLDINPDDILECSGKTGAGVRELLSQVVRRVPAPKEEFPITSNSANTKTSDKTSEKTIDKESNGPKESQGFRGLVFDFQYSNHRGVIVYVRVLDGIISKNTPLIFSAADEKFIAQEVGAFMPEETARPYLAAGEIGYIVTGIKKPGIASVGDTIVMQKNPLPSLGGYLQPSPVVWASVYPESQDDFPLLSSGLDRLRLSDSAFSYEEEASGALGRGYRVGFLGMLHLEILTERLRREFDLELIVTAPSITYEVTYRNKKVETIYSPHYFPDDGNIESVNEPWANVTIITPNAYLGALMPLAFEHEAEVTHTENWGDNRAEVTMKMPLRELMRNFFDELKSTTSGYASISYEMAEVRSADVTRLDILIADDIVPAFTRVVSRRRLEEEAENSVEKLQQILPRQQFEMKVQAKGSGRILASKTIKAFRKDVLMHGSKVVGGGDVSRKKKLLEKQKAGKKKTREYGRVNIPHEVFLKMMRSGDSD